MQDEFVALRRQELVDKIKGHFDSGHHELHDESTLRIRYDKSFDRLVAIDALEAQTRLARSQELLATSQHEAAAAQAAETKRLEQIRNLSDERNFWFRRFLTSLTVAHGAGAFAALTALMRTPPPIATPGQIETILYCFIGGLTLMGSLPITFALLNPEKPDPRRLKNNAPVAWIFAIFASIALAIGVWTVFQVATATYEHNRLTKEPVGATPSLSPARLLPQPDGRLLRPERPKPQQQGRADPGG